MATTLRNVRIWDGEGFAAADAVTLEGERIAAVHCADEAPEVAHCIDCSGLTLLPGLFDAHVHMELNPDENQTPDPKRPDQTPLMIERAAAMVRAGITTARDLGGGRGWELALRERIASGELTGPRLLCAGQPLTSTGGHCHFWGGQVDSIEAARDHIEDQCARGVDLIKVMATGGVMTAGTKPSSAQFDQPTLDAIVEQAHARQRPVAAHCHGSDGIRAAALAGVDTIEHCSWVGQHGWASDYRDTVAALIASRGIRVSPTISRGWRRFLDGDQARLRLIRTAWSGMRGHNIAFVASTDAGIPDVYHHHLPQALPVFAAISGMSNKEVLTSATSGAADGLGVSHITGRIAPGLYADLMLVDGDPCADLSTLAQPAAVWARGRDVLPLD
ncbi:MAG: amidohydrolase family protein [Gammaproteobacteria bacterium]|nr:amidohydrolase family protein [Gammaproteobacteria bacterium]